MAIVPQGAQRASRRPASLLEGIYLSNILTSVWSPAGSLPSVPLAAAVPTAGGAASLLLSAQQLLSAGCGWLIGHPGSGRAVSYRPIQTFSVCLHLYDFHASGGGQQNTTWGWMCCSAAPGARPPGCVWMETCSTSTVCRMLTLKGKLPSPRS